MKVFYSWQSNIPKQRNLLNNAIEKSIKSINKELEIDLALDRDTRNLPGAVEIADKILIKICEARVFIADITLINGSIFQKILKKEITPNPNVLIELGYAVRKIGWENIILLYNTKYGTVENLPFDLRHRRILPFSKYGSELISSIKAAINEIIGERQVSIANRDLDEAHDCEVFSRIMQKMPESDLPNLFSHIGCTRTYVGEETQFIYDMYYDLGLPMNKFIDKQIQEKADCFGTAFNSLSHFLATNFFNYRARDVYEIKKYEHMDDEEKRNDLQEKDYNALNDELDKALNAFNAFRMCVKEKLRM